MPCTGMNSSTTGLAASLAELGVISAGGLILSCLTANQLGTYRNRHTHTHAHMHAHTHTHTYIAYVYTENNSVFLQPTLHGFPCNTITVIPLTFRSSSCMQTHSPSPDRSLTQCHYHRHTQSYHYTLVHGCMVYTECAETAAVSHGTVSK